MHCMLNAGKSLQSLMLVLANPPPAGWASPPTASHEMTDGGDPVPIR